MAEALAYMEEREICAGFLWGNLTENYYFKYLDIGRSIILKWIFKK
jgi:hypothetical protein